MMRAVTLGVALVVGVGAVLAWNEAGDRSVLTALEWIGWGAASIVAPLAWQRRFDRLVPLDPGCAEAISGKDHDALRWTPVVAPLAAGLSMLAILVKLTG